MKRLVVLPMLLIGLAGAGCAAARPAAAPAVGADVREAVPVRDGAAGSPVSWSQLMEAVAGADVIIVGEEHDDAVGHRVELAIVGDVLAGWPGSAVSMEMLDRSEQADVDDYLAGFIDLDTFYERTAATRWLRISREYLIGSISRKTFETRISRLGWPDWQGNYQPIIEAAKSAGAPVVAANTPWLVYMSVARREGFERLVDVTPAQAALFDVPQDLPEGRYRQRFWEVMAGRAEGEPPAAEADAGAHNALTDEQILGMFRGQAVMDATMAASIAAASRAGAVKVVHLVGSFHCDFDGGLVQELRRRLPDARILVISMSRSSGEPGEEPADDDDAGRADFLIDTTAHQTVS